jgi:hypothetical protein
MTLTREKAKELFKKAVTLSRDLDELSTDDSPEVKDMRHHVQGLIYRLARIIDDAEPGSSCPKDPKADDYLNKAADALGAAIKLARDRDAAVNGMDLVERVMQKVAFPEGQ